MLWTGLASILLGIVLCLVGLFLDTTVPSTSVVPPRFGSPPGTAPTSVHNLGLLARQAALVTLGSGLLICGAVLVVGSILRQTINQVSESVVANARTTAEVMRESVIGIVDRRAAAYALSKSDDGPRTMAAHPPQTVPEASEQAEVPAEDWRDVETQAIRLGWSVSRSNGTLRMQSSDGTIRVFGSPAAAQQFLRRSAAWSRPGTP